MKELNLLSDHPSVFGQRIYSPPTGTLPDWGDRRDLNPHYRSHSPALYQLSYGHYNNGGRTSRTPCLSARTVFETGSAPRRIHPPTRSEGDLNSRTLSGVRLSKPLPYQLGHRSTCAGSDSNRHCLVPETRASANWATRAFYPRSDSNRHCMRLERIASCRWATRAQLSLQWPRSDSNREPLSLGQLALPISVRGRLSLST